MDKDIQEHIEILSQQVVQLYQESCYEQALVIARETCTLALQQLGEEHPMSLLCLSNLATLQMEVGNDGQVEELLQRILTLQEIALGEMHPDKAVTLNNLAVFYLKQEKYSQAEPLLLQAIAIWRATPDGPHIDLASCLNNLAHVFDDQGQTDRAIPLYQEAIDIWRDLFGENHPQIATGLNSIGICFMAKDSAEAERFLQEALAMRRALFGEQHQDVAESLNNLGSLLINLGHYQQAEFLCLQALDIHIIIASEPIARVEIWDNLASLYARLGKYARAEDLYHQVLAVKQTMLGENHLALTSTLISLADLHQARGNYDIAEPLFQRALAIGRAQLGAEDPLIASNLDKLGGLYRAMGSYTQAGSYYHQALDIRQKGLDKKHPQIGTSLNNLAIFYHDMDDDVRAEPLFVEALDIARQNWGDVHPDVASSLANLATIFYEQRRYAQARALLEESLAIRQTVLGENHPETAISLNKLALLHYALGNAAQAEDLLQQALEIRKKALGELHPAYATNLHNLAMLYAATNRHQEALALKKQAIAIEDQIMGQVFSLVSENQRQAHLELLQRFVDSFLSLVFSSLSHSSEALQQALELVLRRKSIGMEALAVQQETLLGGRYPSLTTTVQDLGALRARIAQHILESPISHDSEEYQQKMQEWNKQREQLESELARIPEMKLAQSLQTLNRQSLCAKLPADAVLIEFVRYEVFDFQELPSIQQTLWKPARYAAFILHADEPDNVQGIDLGEAIPLEKLVVEFRKIITHPSNSFANRQTQPEQQEVGQRPTEHEGRQRHLRPSVSHSRSFKDDTASGITLRISLFDPLLSALKGKTRLLIAPAGSLYQLPFEALPTSNGSYLIDAYKISYLGTARDLVRQTIPSLQSSTAPCVIADPDFDLQAAIEQSESVGRLFRQPQAASLHERRSLDLKPGEAYFTRLSGTREEGQKVAALLGVEPWLGKEAVEAVLKACQSPRILHIATHGFFLPDQSKRPKLPDLTRRTESRSLETSEMSAFARGESHDTVDRLAHFITGRIENPLLRSGLVLAGVNTWSRGEVLSPEAGDGIITAEDASGLDLRDTALVVLSACETGLGEIHRGEGVLGLRRAFILAGTKTLITSLWKIPDYHTQELMNAFYLRILDGQWCADALREAQLVLREKYPHPYFWAAFICQGNSRPFLEKTL